MEGGERLERVVWGKKNISFSTYEHDLLFLSARVVFRFFWFYYDYTCDFILFYLVQFPLLPYFIVLF